MNTAKLARSIKINRCRSLIKAYSSRKDSRSVADLADLRRELAELLSRPITD
jgi:hypothetical protein